MMGRITATLKWAGRKLWTYFFRGFIVALPLGLTVWILIWIFMWVDGFLQPYLIEPIFNKEIPGVGFAITIVLIFIIGIIVSNILGRRLLRYGESLLNRVPIAQYLYNGIRQIVQAFAAPDKTGFMQVVLVEFPRRGTRTLGFITNETSDESGRKLLNIFIPTSPNPTSGFLQILSEDQVIRTDLSVDDALKMVVSGGRVSIQEVSDKLFVGGSFFEPGTG
ncbi:MAG: DUF502 domain-containing protein [Dehalococcoidales bacterium]|nr:MAG: DUF502 domain-containing protein [Dehalococcoidales bacterium]